MNALKRIHKDGAERLTALTQQLYVPLCDAVKAYRSNLQRLHPFKKVVVDLSARYQGEYARCGDGGGVAGAERREERITGAQQGLYRQAD